MIYLKELEKFKDGSAKYSFSYDKDFIKFYKEKTGKDDLNSKEVRDFIFKYLVELCGEVKETPKRTRKKKV